jgi:hypothetical protein
MLKVISEEVFGSVFLQMRAIRKESGRFASTKCKSKTTSPNEYEGELRAILGVSIEQYHCQLPQ